MLKDYLHFSFILRLVTDSSRRQISNRIVSSNEAQCEQDTRAISQQVFQLLKFHFPSPTLCKNHDLLRTRMKQQPAVDDLSRWDLRSLEKFAARKSGQLNRKKPAD